MALKFLVHFVGDIHQPMHAGRAVDRGGNDVKVDFFYDRTNLHVVWDELLIRRARSPWREYAAELHRRITPQKAAQWRRNMDVGEWAMESARLAASHAYPVPRDGQLGEAYFDRNRPVVEERLSMAGVRLAAVLNGVFAERRAAATVPASGPIPTTRETGRASATGR